MSSVKQPTKESFLHDVRNHICDCLLNNGLYRHYRFKRNDTSDMSFEITTWPSYLCFSGDMGCYVFRRVEDMFCFFRHDDINPSYWAEKLEAVDKSSDYNEWSRDNFEDAVRQQWESYFESRLESDTAKAVWEELEDDVLHNSDSEWAAISAIYNFNSLYEPDFNFNDFFENTLTEYNYHYIWCCYALAWAINKIDTGN